MGELGDTLIVCGVALAALTIGVLWVTLRQVRGFIQKIRAEEEPLEMEKDKDYDHHNFTESQH
ncbi:MAG: hypothetical protein IJ234_07075 [Clostridia bacterium]|nr:hypothetical protein [Clostridia bacterium]